MDDLWVVSIVVSFRHTYHRRAILLTWSEWESCDRHGLVEVLFHLLSMLVNPGDLVPLNELLSCSPLLMLLLSLLLLLNLLHGRLDLAWVRPIVVHRVPSRPVLCIASEET